MANPGNGESRKPQSPSSSTSSFDVFQSQKNELIQSQTFSIGKYLTQEASKQSSWLILVGKKK